MANGLRHRVLEWSPREAPVDTLLLAHGFLDVGLSWFRVAEELVARGHRCIAWDWRGHGQTEWVGAGGYYHFHDYVRDLDALLPLLVPADGPRPHLVDHSMGGSVATLFAGTFPERLASVSMIEGLGPLAFDLERSVQKVRMWLQGCEKAARPADPVSRAQIRGRLERRHGVELDPALAEVLVEELSEPIAGDADARRWRFDPLHRTLSPSPFQPAIFTRFLESIGAAKLPTLVVTGERGYRPPDEDARRAALGEHTFLELPGAGHMMHWHHAPELAAAIHGHCVPA